MIMSRVSRMNRLLAIAAAASALLHDTGAHAQGLVPPGETAMREFLKQGKWSPTADDNISGELLDPAFVASLVKAHRADPKDETAIANLALIPLALAVAEWGVAPSEALPKDPVGKRWAAVESSGDGKHLMSYAKGGIGVAHIDSGILQRFFTYLEARQPDVVPEAQKAGFFRLKGTNFDRLYAGGGHCTKPVSEIGVDLVGARFEHTRWGYAGDNYCKQYDKGQVTVADWQVFRHGMREALRREDVQFELIRTWVRDVWAPSYEMVVVKGHADIREAFVIARIYNSSPRTAQGAFKQAVGLPGVDDRIRKELEVYASPGFGGNPRHKERWPYMQRAVAAYGAFDR